MAAELNRFQVNTLRIIAKLLEKDAVEDSILEELWKNELEYFSLLEKYKILSEKMNIDEKTGLLKDNNRYLSDIVKITSRIMSNNRFPHLEVGFVRFGIDNFSELTNVYGKSLGDVILKTLGTVITDFSRPTDYVIRSGDDEFDVILPSTDIAGTEVYCRKILDKVRKINFHHNETSVKTTMSAGITSCSLSINSPGKKENVELEYENLQKKAADALSEAKFLGKNKCSIYSASKHDEYLKFESNKL